ncbi:hypothetical protein MMC13_003311 [Lambiella insularis]|nr:hypothetical protein [Lambiella insularis]
MASPNTPPMQTEHATVQVLYPKHLELELVQLEKERQLPPDSEMPALPPPGRSAPSPSSSPTSHSTTPPPQTNPNSHPLTGAPHSQPGELTDQGYASTLALGRTLRSRYVDQLHFLHPRLLSASTLHLRSSAYQRTFASLRQVLLGLYPPSTRGLPSSALQVTMRALEAETLLPNEDFCPRFIQLMRAMKRRTAAKWNASRDLASLSALLAPHLPTQQLLAIDAQPSMHALHDTLTAALGTASPTAYLPAAFFDPSARRIIERLAAEEEYRGFGLSREYRALGIGVPLSEAVARMRRKARGADGGPADAGAAREEKMALFACHDSTIGGMLAALGVMRGPGWWWPPYASWLAVELFRVRDGDGDGKRVVRLSYMGRPVQVPACRAREAHWGSDETFCTLDAFEKVVREFTPGDWRGECVANLGGVEFP